jgi:hypothetical protein
LTSARWWSPEAEEGVFPRVGGTGSITTLTDSEPKERALTIGFRALDPPEPWGECAWTARDLVPE